MKKTKISILILVIAVLLSLTALSQLSPIVKTISKTTQITSTINLEEKESCKTEFYDEVQEQFGTCIHYYNNTNCLNSSGPNTDCSLQQDVNNIKCKTGEITVPKNTTQCKPNDEFIITIYQGTATLKKQIDFSEWGPCIYSQENIGENSCLVVTCVSRYDGAHKGQFTDCSGGKSCQRFEICDNSIKTLYKNSREDFVEDDPSFHLNKLAIQEVPK